MHPKSPAPEPVDNTVTDLGPLAWVFDELRKSLEAANKALKRYAADTELARQSDLSAPDPAPLRVARSQLHQVVGALEMVGFMAPATVVRSMESAVQRFISKPSACTDVAIAKMEKAGFALVEYLEAVLNHKAVSPVALFSQYRDVQELAAAQRIHPADLWPAPHKAASVPWPQGLTCARLVPGPDVRAQFDRYVLHVMKSQHPVAARHLKMVSAGLCAGSAVDAQRVFWSAAAAYFEAIQHGLLPTDVHVKRAASRVLLQYSSLAQGGQDVSSVLLHDLLFFAAQACVPAAVATPWLDVVRQTHGLASAQPVDYGSATLGRYDPALLAQARKRTHAAKEGWTLLTGGDMSKARQVVDQFGLVNDSLKKILPSAEPLGTALVKAVDISGRERSLPGPELGLEVATAILYLEAVMQDMDPNDPNQALRMQKMAQRVQAAHVGIPSLPLESWMEDLYRRVSDRHTMGSVVGELKLTLSELERALDAFTRDSADKESMVSVPQQLAQMRGVLSVLGLDHASQAVDHMRGNVEDMLADEIDVVRAQEAGTFIHLANNLSALSFLIDMLNYQPVLARKLFVFDPALCELQPLMGRTLRAWSAPATSPDPGGQLTQSVDDVMRDVLDDSPTAIDIPQLTQRLDHLANDAALADQPAVAAAARHAAAVVATEGVHAGAQALTDLVTAAEPAPLESPPAETGPAPAEGDLLDIFLEEARDVIQAGQVALTALAETPDSMPDMTTLRRAFHTLKGSSRMVGLSAFGEAAWALEQVMNAWLAESRPANVELCGACQQSLEKLNAWVDDIAAHTHGAWQAEPFARSAETLRLQGYWQSLDDFTDATVHTPFADTVPAGLEAEDLTTERPVPDKEPLNLLEVVIGGVDAPVPLEFQSDAVVTDDTEPSAPEASLATDNLIEWSLADGSDDSMIRAVPEPAQVPEERGQEWSLDWDAGSEVAEAAPDPEPKTEPESDGGLPVFELDFDVPEPASAPADIDAPAPELAVVSDEDVKVIGSLRLGVRLFNVFLNEADEWSRRLNHELSEWEMEHGQAVPDTSAALAHSLAGASAAVGFTALADLARALEHALDASRSHAQAGLLTTPQQAALFVDAAEDIRRLLHQFAAGFLKDPQPVLLEALNAFVHHTPPVPEPDAVPEPEVELAFSEAAQSEPEPDSVVFPMEAVASATPETGRIAYVDDDIDAVDTLDADLFQIFEEEAQDLLPHLGAALRQWVARPDNGSARVEVLRTLHTLKGSARLAGALRLGEMAHRLETQAERLGSDVSDGHLIEPLLASYDDMVSRLDALRLPTTTQVAHRITTAPEQAAPGESLPEAVDQLAAASGGQPQTSLMSMDTALPIAVLPPPALKAAAGAAVRVRADLLDRLVNQTGEVMITRSRMEAELGQLRGSLTDLTGNLDRLRLQLRDIELQAESQMQSRMAHSKEADAAFDPLEFDRFTRVQELTRMMAESVNDVATVQRNLQRAVDATEDGLAAQARQTRELQRDLLRTRMVEFEGISDRLYRVVRQSAKETGKQVRLDIFGGTIEMDRGVLDRMTPAFEHLLRNCVGHGIELPTARIAAGKAPEGQITVRLAQEGNDVSVVFEDDGAGLDLPRIREKAVAQGLIPTADALDDDAAAQLIFAPGLSTAVEVTGLSGRGIGMDVVRSDVVGLGGRVAARSTVGQGTQFRMVLPLTTAVTQVVMLRAGAFSLGVPSGLVEVVRRVTPTELQAAYSSGLLTVAGEAVPFFWAGALLQTSAGSAEVVGRTLPVVIFRSAAQRVALHVDEVLGNQEVVVKNLGPQLSRLPGLTAMTVLASGAVALIYNPVALAAVYGERATAWANTQVPRATSIDSGGATDSPPPVDVLAGPPLVLVVDDSITVRRVTQRLLQREGYRVVLASDGLQALEKLAQERPAVVLSDIEMPRMDGFDLVRNIRADDRLASLPVIMITSRIAAKHREHARELGVNDYLGKPYPEEELLALIQRYAAR